MGTGARCAPLQSAQAYNVYEVYDMYDYYDNDSNYIVDSIYIRLPPCEGAVFIVTLFHLTVLQLKTRMFFVQKSEKT